MSSEKLFLSSAQQREISCYYWNLGYDSFQEIRENPSENYQLCNTEFIPPNQDVLQFLLSQNNPGIFLIDDWVNFEEINPLERRRRESQIQNPG